MNIIDLNSQLSPVLQREVEIIEANRNELLKKLSKSEIPADYFTPFISTICGMEFSKWISNVSKGLKLKILDVGFGRGETSLYLAHQGHEVHALEPSPLNCEILQRAASKFELPIQVYQGIAEEIDCLETSNFDLCIFNSSLHHCDGPVLALKCCQKKLSSSGKLLAINEPLLKFFRSKAWFQKKLYSDPIRLGHYGGNEHIYRFHEYLNMFKQAGFESIESFYHLQYQYPRETIRLDLEKKIDGQYIHTNQKLLCKYMIMLLLKSSLKRNHGVLQMMLKRLSLVSVSFLAVKN